MTNRFNLSDWALEHRSLVWYFMIVSAIAGMLAYVSLGREEDPSFTIKTMVIAAQWPGATVEDTARQVSDRIEKKLEELDSLDYTRSQTTPGQSVIYVNLKDTVKSRDVPGVWVKVRNMINDIKRELPQGVVGPVFNDDFGDVFGNVYAFSADGLTQRQLRDYVEDVRAKVLTVPNVGKVNLIGAQDEVIFLEFSTREMAALGVSQQEVVQTLQAQNAITPSGVIEAGRERISVRVSGQFTSEENLRGLNLRVNDRFFRLSDIATISRGHVDPPQALFRFKGQPAIGLAIGMKTGANLLEFGEALKEQMNKVTGELPIGVGVHLVADQPVVVEEAVGGFTKALFEAVAIVLLVSFISLGMRAGLVVAITIPLVLAMTFVVMQYTGISLQRISLGALIIALGLLVDDAMIAVEMMVARLEAGDTLRKAATAVYTSTAFPMLAGTLVTVASFIPVGLNSSNAGEYTFTLFVVIAVSLLLSWIVAVLFAPLLGVALLPKTMKKHHDKPSRGATMFSRVLVGAMRWRWLTIGVTVAMFAVSLYGMRFVEQQFFPSSDRNELLVDFTLAQNASITDTKAQMDRFEAKLAGDADINHWSSYVGQSAVRFILSFDPQPANPNYGQMVIVTKSIAARERLRAKIKTWTREEFAGLDVYVDLLAVGPPAGRPVQYRLSGPDTQKVRELAQQLAALVGEHPRVSDIGFNWNEPARVVKIDVLQDKARQLGVTSQDIAGVLNGVVGGTSITQVRDAIYLVDVVSRASAAERGAIETLQNLQLPRKNGQSVPLAAVATFRYELEQPVIWRRSRLPTVTIRGSIVGETQPATIAQQLEPKVQEFIRALPAGYAAAVAGPVEESAKSQGPIAAVVPLMLFLMATILMIQMQSFSRLFLVIAAAPLGLIGVVAAMLPSGAPMGFVAILGVLALIGILIRNSVILIVQIEDLRREGCAPWQAVVEATMHRTRPILLTAAAASLALIPISREVFWGPMAYAMMGGIIVGTLLTLLFLPALYVAWFGIKAPSETDAEPLLTHELPAHEAA
jgi:multidrug efflux pump subunit AcrB